MITFQKSFGAALLCGAVAVMTPMLLHAQTTRTNGSATTNGSVQVPASDGASRAAGANAAGAASESSGQNLAPNTPSTGTYGGMGTETDSTINNDVNNAKKKATSPATSSPTKLTSPTTAPPH